jgi:hypothetical protein
VQILLKTIPSCCLAGARADANLAGRAASIFFFPGCGSALR